jgi:hypothetical protein
MQHWTTFVTRGLKRAINCVVPLHSSSITERLHYVMVESERFVICTSKV